VVGFLIVFIGAISTKGYSVGIVTDQSNIKLFYIESIFRIFFNPLWAICLWLYEKGLKLNSDRHEAILLNIQGFLTGAGVNIPSEKIYDLIFKYENIEKLLNEKFKKDDTIKSGPGSPII